MIKKVNKNKFGVIEYSITNEEDLKDLPKGDIDNSVYAVDDNNKVYLYSKKANDYILINGDWATNSNGLSIRPINMGEPSTEVDFGLFHTNGYYTVMGAIDGRELHNSIVFFEDRGGECIFTLYEYCKFLHCTRDGEYAIYGVEELFPTLQTTIGNLDDLPLGLQDCNNLVEAITILYNNSNPL